MRISDWSSDVCSSDLVSWDEAIGGIGDKLMEIREKSGPEAVYWMGSAKFSNEGTYLFRKLAAFWGTNNQDHQARICHSTTVSGVANRSEEHTSELQSLMRISYAVFCLKQKNKHVPRYTY